MATRADRYILFLLGAVLVADARPALGTGPALDLAGQQQLDTVLAERFPELDRPGRRALLARALQGIGPLQSGLALLGRIESACAKLKPELEGPRQAAEVVRSMLSIAQASGPASPQAQLVLQATLAHIGLHGRATLAAQPDGSLALVRSA